MNIEIMRLLVEFRVDANTRNNYRLTPLHITGKNGDIEVIKLLMTKFRADVNIKKWVSQDYEAACG
ncbi:hypothetical protein BC938DRAFT_476985 [Jimgerdemannia flammicorona]|uniref:Uncharacterized protein n=1 Tax=Jimgerdemannia flammicorona TaxID=994334 RepID=A0A433PCV5_9FUNG|nr:hypothetical protein BC938DRAFT_476985 [Jimgerdemannia flammicorona]